MRLARSGVVAIADEGEPGLIFIEGEFAVLAFAGEESDWIGGVAGRDSVDAA